MSLSGQGTLDHHKRSYRFDRQEGKGTGTYASFKLSAQSQDRSFLRTVLGYRVLSSFGLLVPEVEPVALYLNGDFAGLYLMIERVDENFFDRRSRSLDRLYKARIWKARFGDRMTVDPEHGLEASFGAFHHPEIARLSEWAASDRAVAESLLDHGAVTAFFATTLFLGNWDGFVNNFYVAKERGDTRLRFIPWDWERVYDLSFGGRDEVLRKIHYLSSLNRVMAKSLSVSELRSELVGSLRRLVEAYPPKTIRKILDEEETKILRAYQADPFLGGFGLDPGAEKDRLLGNYAIWMEGLSLYLQEFAQTP